MIKIDPRRAAIVAEAKEWLKTPYHHAAKLKGIGCDCLTYIVGVYENVGIVGPQKIPFYRPDFMRHNSTETYLEGLLEHGHEVKAPLSGDIAIFKWGRIFAHAGIVTEWPRILHADPHNGVIEMRGNTGRLMGREVKFISAFNDGEPV